MKIYIDGKYYSKVDAKISVFDHGLLYGDGVFEGIRIYNSKIFKLKEHIERLYASAKAILLEIPMEIKEMEDAVINAVKENNKKNGYIRLLITRGTGDLGINPYLCPKASVIIIVGDIQLYPEEHYRKGISLITSSIIQTAPNCLDPRIKSLNYLNNIMGKIQAKNAGCLEAIMLNNQGQVCECTADNIFIVKDKKIITPNPNNGLLCGITRQTILDIAEQSNIALEESIISVYDLYNADECFLTGTGAEIMPVINIDGRVIGNGSPGDTTQLLKKLFKDFIS